MELRNDPRLYSAGSVAFDSSPSVNVYAQLMAKKQAKDEAIDEYYRKLPSTLNSAGMRDQDRAGFDQAVAEWQKHWIQNKDKIRKGNSQEAFDTEQKFRSLQEAIQRSKDAAKTDLELGKMRFSKENSYIFDDDDFVNSQHQHALPIWDARHKPMDLATVALPPRPFEAKDQDEYYKSIVSGMEAGKKYDYSKSYTNPQTGQVIVPTIDVLNDDQIKKAAERAMELVATDKSKKKFFEKGLNTGRKEDWDVLQNAYSKYFKGEVDSPEKAAAADAIIKLSIPKKYAEEQEINYQQKQNDKRINITLNQGGGGNNSSIRDVFAEIDGLVSNKSGGNLPLNELTTTAQSVVLKQARDLMGDDELSQDRVYITKKPDGKIVIRKTAKSRVISPNDPIIGEMDFEGTNIGVQPSVKEKREVIQQGNKTKQQTSSGMVTVILKDGRKGQIPSDKVAQFLKDNPGAKKQ